MAEKEVKFFHSYDKDNDLLFVRFGQADKAVTFQFEDWLTVKLASDDLRPLEIQVLDFSVLVEKLKSFSKKHKKGSAAGQKVAMSYDKASDDLWFKFDTEGPMFQRVIDDHAIAYFNQNTGNVSAIRIPQYSKKSFSFLKKILQTMIGEIMKEAPKKKLSQDNIATVFAGLIVQTDLRPLQELAGAH